MEVWLFDGARGLNTLSQREFVGTPKPSAAMSRRAPSLRQDDLSHWREAVSQAQ